MANGLRSGARTGDNGRSVCDGADRVATDHGVVGKLALEDLPVGRQAQVRQLAMEWLMMGWADESGNAGHARSTYYRLDFEWAAEWEQCGNAPSGMAYWNLWYHVARHLALRANGVEPMDQTGGRVR